MLSKIKNIKKIFSFLHPCVIQFHDGTYGIRRFRFRFVFKDFLLANETVFRDSIWDYRTKRDPYFLRGDCKLKSYDDVMSMFTALYITKKEKKKKENDYTVICSVPKMN